MYHALLFNPFRNLYIGDVTKFSNPNNDATLTITNTCLLYTSDAADE